MSIGDSFMAIVHFDPELLRGKHAISAHSEVLMHIDSAFAGENIPGNPSISAPGENGEEVHAMMVLSTAHISQETATAMEAQDLPFTCFANEYGFVVSTLNFATDRFEPSIPDDLAKVQAYARERGAAYIMLDRDGPTVERLPEYEW